MIQKVDPSRCPLCGEVNVCAQVVTENSERGQNCWCMQEKVPPALLEKLPESHRNLACVCQACVAAYRVEQNKA